MTTITANEASAFTLVSDTPVASAPKEVNHPLFDALHNNHQIKERITKEFLEDAIKTRIATNTKVGKSGEQIIINTNTLLWLASYEPVLWDLLTQREKESYQTLTEDIYKRLALKSQPSPTGAKFVSSFLNNVNPYF